MSNRRGCSASCLLLLLACWVGLTSYVAAEVGSLDSGVEWGKEQLQHVKTRHTGKLPTFANVGKLYVTGVSSGAYMAGQLSVAYSSQVSGVGMFAGGPYGCARGVLAQALEACTDDSLPLDLSTLQSLTQDASNLGTIDNLSNLENMPTWILHGIADSTVKASVVEANVAMYQSWGANVVYVSRLAVEAHQIMR
jgi:hypothetical protein